MRHMADPRKSQLDLYSDFMRSTGRSLGSDATREDTVERKQAPGTRYLVPKFAAENRPCPVCGAPTRQLDERVWLDLTTVVSAGKGAWTARDHAEVCRRSAG